MTRCKRKSVKVTKPSNVALHAYGSKIKPTWNGGDYATVGLDTASGALSGAIAGSVVPVIGTVAGAIAGGLIGLGKGIFGSSAKSKLRAQALEANRQQTIEAMNNRIQTDQLTNIKPRSNTFYANGGRMMGRNIPSNALPISHDSELMVGPKHEGGGIQYGPSDEVEGGETTQNVGQETRVYSDRLIVPGTKVTFADMSLKLMKAKGELESKFSNQEDNVRKELDIVSAPKGSVFTRNSSKRRAEIGHIKSMKVLSQVDGINAQLDALFSIQENMSGNSQESSEQGITKHDGGGTVFDTYYKPKPIGILEKFSKPNYNSSIPIMLNPAYNSEFIKSSVATPSVKEFNPSSMGMQFASDALDTISQSITSAQMAKIPLPKRRMIKPVFLDSNYDNSAEIATIESQGASAKKFIADNVSNPQIRRATMISLTNRLNSAKTASMINRNRIEQSIENQNKQIAFQTMGANNEASFQNGVDQFNKTVAGYERTSQIAANFSTKISNLQVAKQQQDNNDISLGLMLTSYTDDARKKVLKAIREGKPIRQALYQ